jgi:flotillin
VAELEKERAIGEQTAAFQREAQVREAERVMRVAVAEANAKAVAGENKSKAEIAGTNAELRVREADAYQLGETRQRESQAKVLEAQYIAQARAAEAQGKKIEAEKRAELESLARAVKAQTIVDAEASAERKRIEAEGDAAAIYARLAAQAKGEYEILAKKGDGLKRIVDACGGAQPAFQMLMLEHIEALSRTAAQAISNVKFDKVVVWDGGSTKDGTNATGNFLRGMASSLPPVMHLMKDIGGVEMPAYFGKLVMDPASETAAPPAAPTAPPKS